MKNPLTKRLPRELKHDWKKYIVLLLFMVAMIGLASGVEVANGSMVASIDESYEKYNIEHGHFNLKEQASDQLLSDMPEEITIYEQFYKECSEDIDLDQCEDATVRIYAIRQEVNTACIHDGRLPEGPSEIAIDAGHARSNHIHTGDTMIIGGETFTVSGLIASPDYSSLYKNNSDFLFNAIEFNVAVVTDETWAALPSDATYQYAFQYKVKPENAKAQKEIADDLMGRIAMLAASDGVNALTDFVPEYANQAIHFAPDDLGKDRALVSVMVYVFIGVLAFIFAITTSNTIVNESAVIGTLRATGYRRSEVVRHYMIIPICVTFLAAILGNLLGYTLFKNVCVNLYYSSYSLIKYETRWNAKAFLVTTIVPILLMALVNFIVIYRKLRLSPLRFLRRDLSTSKRTKAVRLPSWKFMKRFRLRILLHNVGGYLVLFFGIAFVMFLMAFAISLPETIDHYQSSIEENAIARNQYILKGCQDSNGQRITTQDEAAETISIENLLTTSGVRKGEEITVYGYAPDSRYIAISDTLEGNEVFVSEPYQNKFHLSVGDTITLEEKFEDVSYSFTVRGIYDFSGSLCIFLPQENFNHIFHLEAGAFTGYMSDNIISDLPEDMIYTTIDAKAMTGMAAQLDYSVGGILDVFSWVCMLMGLLLMYLLTKIIIEKNAGSISMLKVLGYRNREINGLFILLTSIVVLLSTAVCAFLGIWGVMGAFRLFLNQINGWFDVYISVGGFTKMVLLLLLAYAFVAFFDMQRMKKIPLSDALKNVE